MTVKIFGFCNNELSQLLHTYQQLNYDPSQAPTVSHSLTTHESSWHEIPYCTVFWYTTTFNIIHTYIPWICRCVTKTV